MCFTMKGNTMLEKIKRVADDNRLTTMTYYKDSIISACSQGYMGPGRTEYRCTCVNLWGKPGKILVVLVSGNMTSPFAVKWGFLEYNGTVFFLNKISYRQLADSNSYMIPSLTTRTAIPLDEERLERIIRLLTDYHQQLKNYHQGTLRRYIKKGGTRTFNSMISKGLDRKLK